MSPELALIVAAIYLVLQFVEGTVLVPMVMRNTIGISPLFVLVSLLIGSAAGGFVGAFLAVPIAAAFEIVLSAAAGPRHARRPGSGGIETEDSGDSEDSEETGRPTAARARRSTD